MQPDQLGQVVGGQGTPSPLSPTPSPAGSVGSVGSQSSGYRSDELASQRVAPGNNIVGAAPTSQAVSSIGPIMPVPLHIHTTMQKQTQQCSYLISCHDLWDQADILISKGKHTGKKYFITQYVQNPQFNFLN